MQYKKLDRNKKLAELIGITLGDGNIYKHPRTQNLRITCNSGDSRYILHICRLIKEVFGKKPSVAKRKHKRAVSINLYQGKISERLGIPAGNKIKNNVGIPRWAFLDRKYMLICLKGLFETDGCLQEDKKNYAQYIEFKNYCKKLLEDVYNILIKLGFNPQKGKSYIRLARKKEVYNFIKQIDFRNYIAL
jgi:hypothetical protein